MHRDPQGLGKAQIEPIKGRVGHHNISDRAVAFKSMAMTPPGTNVRQTLIGRSRYERRQQMTLEAQHQAQAPRRP